MTPSQRRIALIIILAEGIGLAALAAVVLAIKNTEIAAAGYFLNFLF
jgi:hypothetical protein